MIVIAHLLTSVIAWYERHATHVAIRGFLMVVPISLLPNDPFAIEFLLLRKVASML
jgi:hypothetical protein